MSFARRAVEYFTMADYDHREARAVDWVTGAAMMVRRQAIEKVGLMDERYFFYFEDVDWCRRFWQSGWRVVYFPEAQMTHYHTRESAEKTGLWSLTSKMTRVHIRSGIKYFWKYRRQKDYPQQIFRNLAKHKHGA
jgi:GT2 family glycosyltransferase